MGESFGNFIIGNDNEIFPLITSCNIACGFHGGDPFHIENTLKKAIQHRVRIGCHPSYPDLQGFGRRKMLLKNDELKSIIKYQIAALKSLTESLGGKLIYVKPHGALYNSIAEDMEEAKVVIQSIKEIDKDLALMGLAGSFLEDLAKEKNIEFIAEAFADRRYEKNGKLMSRNKPNAVIKHPLETLEQVLSIIQKEEVKTLENEIVKIQAQSICIHGDNPAAVEILKVLNENLKSL